MPAPAAGVSRCPALAITDKAFRHEFPQVTFLNWHWRVTRHTKKLGIYINLHSITEELTCRGKSKD
jgi:hypothetical protein